MILPEIPATTGCKRIFLKYASQVILSLGEAKLKAEDQVSVSMDESRDYARTAEDQVSASMDEKRVDARTAEDLVSVSMDVSRVNVRTAEDQVSVSIGEYNIDGRVLCS